MNRMDTVVTTMTAYRIVGATISTSTPPGPCGRRRTAQRSHHDVARRAKAEVKLLEMPTRDDICAKMPALADHLVFAQEKKRNAAKMIAARMIGYVQAHYDQEMSLKILSQALHFHAAYLGQVFKAETGQLFSDCLCAYPSTYRTLWQEQGSPAERPDRKDEI